MTARVYGLFVGIDKYLNISSLAGCVADVTSMRKLLEARIAQPEKNFRWVELLNERATRSNVIRTFQEHLGQASQGDVALFYYAGHGSLEKAPEQFARMEAGGRYETMVCHDSRLDGPDHWDLADKELSALIAHVAGKDPEKAPHIVIVLDCCHSGSGTRDSEDVVPRQVDGRQAGRPLTTFWRPGAAEGSPADAARLQERWLMLPHGSHVLMAACLPEETAKETSIQGQRRGVFSYYLQEALQQATSGTPSYRDLFKRVNALVRTTVPDQTPQLESTDQRLDQPFLGGAVVASPPYFTMRRDPGLGWTIDGGTIHGIADPSEGSTTLMLFPDVPGVSLGDKKNAVGRAEVLRAVAGQSSVRPTLEGDKPLDQPTYKAVVTSAPVRRLAVAFEGDPVALERVRAALRRPSSADVSLVREVTGSGEAEYRLRAAAGRYRIYRMADRVDDGADDTSTLAVASSVIDDINAGLVAQQLEHIARWVRVAELRNVQSAIPEDAIALQVTPVDERGQKMGVLGGSEVCFEYRPVDGQPLPQRFKLTLTNRGQREYFCILLDLTQRYRVWAGYLNGKECIRIGPGETEEIRVFNRARNELVDAFPARIPDEVLARDEKTDKDITYRDIIKLIVSTEASDGRLLEQGNLPLAAAQQDRSDLRANLNALQQLMRREHEREGFDEDPGAASLFSDWRTTELLMTTVMPGCQKIHP